MPFSHHGQWIKIGKLPSELARKWGLDSHKAYEFFFDGNRIKLRNSQGEIVIDKPSTVEEILSLELSLSGSRDISKIRKEKIMSNQEYYGDFTAQGIEQVPDNMEGLYYIHTTDLEQGYIGKSDSCIKNRLKAHLQHSSNQRLRQLVSSGEDLLFFCWESPDPKYEEALEIKRLKNAGLLKQRNEKKPLTHLD